MLFAKIGSSSIAELDVMIGDTYPEIRAHETKIMMRLVDVIVQNASAVSVLIDNCAELDCLIAISKVCKEYGFVRPVFTNNRVVKIKQGKHPLHAINSDNFVPNDISSSLEDGFVKILTGANSCGKSVYMKQVALICYLAHIGSFVPAESAVLSPLARVRTRVQSTECVAAHMSAFLIDLRQMSSALQEFSSDSLILIDEFGKGTSEVDGLALLAACLNHFLFQGAKCPHVLVSTHFLNIKEFLLKTPLVRFQTFEHVMQDGEPVFLFRLTEGTAERSFALEVAAASGLDSRLLRRASEVQQCIKVILTNIL
ncbi:MutS protein homolog 5 [Eumeta japonica]|uniref:MutS protein homolog 5 n=1 Tax=Eumeta variegata TaxID=151549 RepID=A0A4C1YQK6_EUMVA|nr:MutS protein homolog 5 [Eumeta japonica]